MDKKLQDEIYAYIEEVDKTASGNWSEEDIVKMAEHFYMLGRNFQPDNYEDFKDLVMKKVGECPRCWRKGQAVFNVVDEQFNVAREVQFVDNVDCYYDDTKIEEFLRHAWIAYCAQVKQNECAHFYVMKDGRCVSDYDNKEDALKHARKIGGQLAYEV